MEKYNYTRVSDFIRDAVLDKRLTQRQVVEIEPYKIDNNRLIPQVIDAIRIYNFRLALVIIAFEEALNIPYVDPELIHMHARRLRLIGAALGGKIEWLIRFMEEKRPEVMGNTGMMNDAITLIAMRYERKNAYFCKLARIPQHQLSIYLSSIEHSSCCAYATSDNVKL